MTHLNLVTGSLSSWFWFLFADSFLALSPVYEVRWEILGAAILTVVIGDSLPVYERSFKCHKK